METKSIFLKTYCTAMIFVYSMISFNIFAQVVNYTEVNVYGWGLAINEGAPVFYDIDDDGYMDMLVGNSVGTLWHYEQSSGDEFVLVSREFSGIDVQSESAPAITDIDQDGLLDLIVGCNGDIKRFEQESVDSYHFSKIDVKMYDIDIGASWVPAFADLNNDGLLEMIVGESLSNLNFFEQDSFAAGTFTLVDQNWMGWYGQNYQSPVFNDFDQDGLLDLLVGNVNGRIAHLVQDSVNAMTFHEVTNLFGGIDVGESATPQILDIDADGKLDLYVGEWYIGVHHFEQDTSGSENFIELNDEVLGMHDFGAMIGYTIHDIDNDGLIDMLVSAYHDYYNSYILHYEQDQTGSLKFNLIDDTFNDISIGNYNHLCLYDINNNGRLDLFIGDVFGFLKRYEQDEINSYGFTLQEEKFNNEMHVNQTPQLAFADIDGDLLLEMIAGEGDGRLHLFKQDSANAVTFTKIVDRYLDLKVGYYSSPAFTDIDGDSLLDLVIGGSGGNLYYYEQDSVNSTDFTQITREFGSVFADNQATPRFADVNNDGKIDLFVGDHGGGIMLHIRNDDLDITPPAVPQNLTAETDGNNVNLTWTPCSDADLMLYNIYRGVRNEISAAEYLYSADAGNATFIDSSLTKSGIYFYWVSALDLVGNESDLSLSDSIEIEITDISFNQETFLNKFNLYQNYPNPFNPKTIISYQLAVNSRVELSIFNLLGQKIATLVSEKQKSGAHELVWNASNFSSGVYFYHLQTDQGFSQTRKLVLMQ